MNAQQARRILDRIVGYQLSPLLWNKVRRGLSAGRVQSVTVRLIVEREREIEAFEPEEYWEVEADLAPEGVQEAVFRAKLAKLDGEKAALPNEEITQALVTRLKGADFAVSSLKEKERSLRPPPPFNTSSLQQQASIRLRFSAKKTMVLAQQLYEGVELGDEGAVGLITYMRTDSFRLSDQALTECRQYIGESFPEPYLPEKPNVYRSGRGAQGAHEAIRPTEAARTPEAVKPHLSRDQFRLYELIWKRFVASQMTPGRLAVVDAQIMATGMESKGGDATAKESEPKQALFTAQGRRLLFDGHLRLTGYDGKDDNELPDLTEGQALALQKLDPSQHFTKPPPRYTEATLVKTLEKLGIGRPSTYAPIISTIQDRGYVDLKTRQFFATELGKLVTDQLVEHFTDIMNVEFTSRMEEELDEVEEAKADWVKTLREFYEPFAADLKKAEKNMKRPEPEETEFKCEKCDKPMLKRWGRRGAFLGCSGYPECRFTQPLDDEGNPVARPEPEQLDEKCPDCGEPLVKRTGRHGEFIGCSAYPKCKYVRSLQQKIEVPDELKKCEECGKEMVVRRGRRGPFLGCTGYPKCRNTKPLPKEAGKKEDAKADAS